jgi:hypothetical protein
VSFAKEALKRYILLNLIEGEALANNGKIMEDISKNAIKAAETMREIDNMFWSKKKEFHPMENNKESQFNNYYPPQQQPPFTSYPVFDAAREASERQQRIANHQMLVQNLYSQLNALQANLFENVQKIHQQISEISKSLY